MNMADPVWYMETAPGVYGLLGQALTAWEPELKTDVVRCRCLHGCGAAYRLGGEASCGVGPFFLGSSQEPVFGKLMSLLQRGLSADALKTGLVAVWPQACGKAAVRQEAYMELLDRRQDRFSLQFHFTGPAEEGAFDEQTLAFTPGGKQGLEL